MFNYKKYLDFVLLGWVIWVIYPLFGSGFISDDSYNSQIRGVLVSYDISIWTRVVDEIKEWLTVSGRFNPLNWILWYPYFYFLPNVLLFKVVVFVLIFIDIVLFRKIVEYLTKNKNFSYFGAFLLPLFFQFRAWHDPFLAFATIPLHCVFLFSSIIFLIKYLEEKKKAYLFWFSIVYVLALLNYELTYVFVLIYLPFIYFYRTNNKVYAPLVVIFLSTLLHIGTRIFFYEGGSGVEYLNANLHTNMESVLQSFFIQLVAALPHSWKLADAALHHKFYLIGLDNIVIFGLFAVLFARNLFNFDISSLKRGVVHRTILFSLGCFLAPALAASVSGHQVDLISSGLGYGYIVVFIQYFGVSILILLLLLILKDKFSSSGYKYFILSVFCIAIFLSGSITREENQFQVKEINKFYKYPRDLLASSIEKGILNQIDSQDLIIRNEKYPSDHSWFISQKANKHIDACGIGIKHEFPYCLSPEYKIAKELVCTKCPKFAIVSKSNHQEALLMRKSIQKKSSRGIPREAILKELINEYGENVIIRRNLMITDYNQKIYGLSYFLGKEHENGSVILASLEDILFVDEIPIEMRFSKYRIYNLVDNSILDYSSTNNYDFLKIIRKESDIESENYNMDEFLTQQISIGFKNFHNEEGDQKRYLRWSSGESTIIVFNKTDEIILKNLSFDLIRPDDKLAVISIKQNDSVRNLELEHSVKVDLLLTLKPGVNHITFVSMSPHIDNGDPRKIVFGISNYKLEVD